MGDHGARQLSPLRPRRLVRRDRRGGYVLNLSADDREALRQLVPQIAQLLDEPDQPVLQRLFPPAYADQQDAAHQEEYRRLMQEDLVDRHRQALELVVVHGRCQPPHGRGIVGLVSGSQQHPTRARDLSGRAGERGTASPQQRRGGDLPMAQHAPG